MHLIRYSLAFGLGCLALSAHAQTGGWQPSKNVEVIVQSAAGGSSDRSARVTQRILQGLPGFHSVSVNNKPGGGGTVAWVYLNQQTADAHYIATMSTTLLTNNLLGRSPLNYRLFTPLSILLREYPVFATRAESPITSARDLVERLRKEGRARILGVSSAERQPGALAELPTLKEQGSNAVFCTWRGFMGPKGMKPAEIAYWDATFEKLAKSPDWRKETEKQFWNPAYLLSAAFAKQLDAEVDQTRAILSDLGLIAQGR